MDFIIGTTLGVIGALLCVYFIKQLASPLVSLLKIGGQKTKVNKTSKRIVKIDQLISSGKTSKAINELEKSFLLDIPKTLPSISEIRMHNQEVLSRCLTIAEDKGAKVENIAQVEHLLLERTELFTLYLKAKESFSTLRTKRKKEGKKTPDWSKNEFQNKIEQIEDELHKNNVSISIELKKLFDYLSKDNSEDIVYH